MGVIRWEEPPASHRVDRYDWAAIGAELVAHPGIWAMVAVANNSVTAGAMANHIRNGKYLKLAELGRFDAKARSIDGENRVYARYIGEVGSDV